MIAEANEAGKRLFGIVVCVERQVARSILFAHRQCHIKKKFYAAPHAFLHALPLSLRGVHAVPGRKYKLQALLQFIG